MAGKNAVMKHCIGIIEMLAKTVIVETNETGTESLEKAIDRVKKPTMTKIMQKEADFTLWKRFPFCYNGFISAKKPSINWQLQRGTARHCGKGTVLFFRHRIDKLFSDKNRVSERNGGRYHQREFCIPWLKTTHKSSQWNCTGDAGICHIGRGRNWFLCKGNTNGGRTGNILTIPIYGISKFLF